MGSILVTGATGNVGREVVALLRARGDAVVEAVREARGGGTVRLDFRDRSTWAAAARGCDRMFLVRPPAIAHLRRRGHPASEILVQTVLHGLLRFGQGATEDPTLARLLGRPGALWARTSRSALRSGRAEARRFAPPRVDQAGRPTHSALWSQSRLASARSSAHRLGFFSRQSS